MCFVYGNSTVYYVNGFIMSDFKNGILRLQMENGHKNRVCDGTMDCQDFSDEVACTYCKYTQ